MCFGSDRTDVLAESLDLLWPFADDAVDCNWSLGVDLEYRW